MPYRDKEKKLEWDRNFARTHRAEANARAKEHYEKHAKEKRVYEKEYYHRESLRLKSLIREIFGDSCAICGNKQNLNYHEINGKKHPYNTLAKLKYILAHREDFLLLCYECHKAVHYLLKKKIKVEVLLWAIKH